MTRADSPKDRSAPTAVRETPEGTATVDDGDGEDVGEGCSCAGSCSASPLPHEVRTSATAVSAVVRATRPRFDVPPVDKLLLISGIRTFCTGAPGNPASTRRVPAAAPANAQQPS